MGTHPEADRSVGEEPLPLWCGIKGGMGTGQVPELSPGKWHSIVAVNWLVGDDNCKFI